MLVVLVINELFIRNNSAFYTVLLDASQAFDRVQSLQYNKLFNLLSMKNIESYMLRLLINTYTKQTLMVKCFEVLSENVVNI